MDERNRFWVEVEIPPKQMAEAWRGRRITIDAPGLEMPCPHCGESLSVRLAPGAWAILNCGELALLVTRARA